MSDIPTAMISRLIPRYAEPHRRYHTWSHIGACFEARERLVTAGARVGDPEEVREFAVDLALLYHDAIYEPLAKDNEERSAQLLLDEGLSAGLKLDVLERASAFILTTKHDAIPISEPARIVVDADLSILGSDDATFDRYEDAIRQEYSVVPDAAFAAGRMKVMDGFRRREHIFQTKAARDLWERKARENIGRSLRRWGAS